jgi:hypothetical protein
VKLILSAEAELVDAQANERHDFERDKGRIIAEYYQPIVTRRLTYD